MYLTYHKEVTSLKDTMSMPMEALNQDIIDFMVKNNCLQSRYNVRSNGYAMFIYLDNGDRVDVQL
jgi:hypothetical protein